jgi:hypothetical protein
MTAARPRTRRPKGSYVADADRRVRRAHFVVRGVAPHDVYVLLPTGQVVRDLQPGEKAVVLVRAGSPVTDDLAGRIRVAGY